jgi:hypothetical protein
MVEHAVRSILFFFAFFSSFSARVHTHDTEVVVCEGAE